MNTENITRVRRLDLNTVLYSGSAYQSQGSSAAGHWIILYITTVMEGFVGKGRASHGRVPMCSLKFRSNMCVCYY